MIKTSNQIKKFIKKVKIFLIRIIMNRFKKNKILNNKHYDRKCCHYEFNKFGKIINFHTISYGCCHKYFEN